MVLRQTTTVWQFKCFCWGTTTVETRKHVFYFLILFLMRWLGNISYMIWSHCSIPNGICWLEPLASSRSGDSGRTRVHVAQTRRPPPPPSLPPKHAAGKPVPVKAATGLNSVLSCRFSPPPLSLFHSCSSLSFPVARGPGSPRAQGLPDGQIRRP